MVDETQNTQAPGSNDASDADVMKAASQTFPQYSPDLIASTVQNVKKVHPELTNSMIIQDVIPQLQQSMKSGDFQKMAVQQSIKSKMGVGNTGTLPAQQEQAAAVVPNNVVPGMTQQQKMQQAAMGAYPDVQKELGDQFAQQQSMQVTGQDAALKTQENAQKNVGYQQGQQNYSEIQQQMLDPNSNVSQFLQKGMKSVNPNLPWEKVSGAQINQVAPQIVETMLKTGGLSTFNAEKSTQSAKYDPVETQSGIDSATSALQLIAPVVDKMKKAGTWTQKAETALAFAAENPNDEQAQQALLAYDPDFAAGMQYAKRAALSGSKGGTDFALGATIRSVVNSGDPVEAMKSYKQSLLEQKNKMDAQYKYGQEHMQNYQGQPVYKPASTVRGNVGGDTAPTNSSASHPGVNPPAAGPSGSQVAVTTRMIDPKNPSVVRTVSGDVNSAAVQKYLKQGKQIVQ